MIGKDDDVGVGLCGDAAETQGVPRVVGHGVEQRGLHVVVAQDDGISFFLQAQNVGRNLRLQQDLRIGHDVAKLALQVLVNCIRLHRLFLVPVTWPRRAPVGRQFR